MHRRDPDKKEERLTKEDDTQAVSHPGRRLNPNKIACSPDLRLTQDCFIGILRILMKNNKKNSLDIPPHSAIEMKERKGIRDLRKLKKPRIPNPLLDILNV